MGDESQNSTKTHRVPNHRRLSKFSMKTQVSTTVENDVEDMIEMREGVDAHTNEDTVGSIVQIICQGQEIMEETKARAVIMGWFEEAGVLEQTPTGLADNN